MCHQMVKIHIKYDYLAFESFDCLYIGKVRRSCPYYQYRVCSLYYCSFEFWIPVCLWYFLAFYLIKSVNEKLKIYFMWHMQTICMVSHTIVKNICKLKRLVTHILSLN